MQQTNIGRRPQDIAYTIQLAENMRIDEYYQPETINGLIFSLEINSKEALP